MKLVAPDNSLGFIEQEDFSEYKQSLQVLVSNALLTYYGLW